MKGQSLRHLAKVCDIAKLDVNAEVIHLDGTEDSLRATYRGSFCSAFRTAESDAGEIDVCVDATHFQNAVALLGDDDDIKLTEKEDALILKSKRSTLQLKRVLEEPRPFEFIEGAATFKIRGADFLEEAAIAAKFVAKSLARPVFTGIRLIPMPKWLGITTSDGHGIIYQSAVRCRGVKIPPFTVPTADFLLGLQIVQSKSIEVVVSEGRVALYGDGAGFDSVLQTGEWPQARLPEEGDFTLLTVESDVLRRAVAAARLFQTDNSVHFKPTRSGANIVVRSEAGGFSTGIDGELRKEVQYDVDALGLVSELGGELNFEVSFDGKLRVQQKPRTVWLADLI